MKWIKWLAGLWDFVAHVIGACIILYYGLSFIAGQVGNFDRVMNLLIMASVFHLVVKFMWEPTKKYIIKRKEVMESCQH